MRDERLALLVRAGEIFHQSLDLTATLNNVARLAVEAFSDICLFDLLDERSERLFVTSAAHSDPAKEGALAGVSSLLYIEEFGVHPVVRVTRSGEPFFVPVMDEEMLVAHAASREHERYMRELGYRSKIVVPVTAQDRIFGALTFVRTDDRPHFEEADLMLALELGRRAGVAIANAKQFHRERYVAETLQRAFLPNRFPVRADVEITAHYRPGSDEADIGGDWYDAFETKDGSVVITIGDVTGKGVDAARIMVLMRQAVRIAALDSRDPKRIAKTCNRVLLAERAERLASLFIGILAPGGRTLTYVSAGHAPPFLRLPSGDLVMLAAPSPPLGALQDVEFEIHRMKVADGSMLVLYTDGMIEIGRDAVAGERMLQDLLSSRALPHAVNPAAFIERAIADQAPRDDIAILVVRFGASEVHWRFEASDARAAYAMRREFFRELERLCDPSEEELSLCGVVFAEVVGNAVRHAPGELSVSLELRGERIVLHVIDRGRGFEYHPHLPADVWAESGRGLFLISVLCPESSVERVPGLGSHVEVMLPILCSEPSHGGVAVGASA